MVVKVTSCQPFPPLTADCTAKRYPFLSSHPTAAAAAVRAGVPLHI